MVSVELRFRNQGGAPHEVAAVGEHQRFQVVLGGGERLLRGEEVLLEGGHLGLRGHHVDGRQNALFGLAAIALVLALGEAHGLGLHVADCSRRSRVPSRPAWPA